MYIYKIHAYLYIYILQQQPKLIKTRKNKTKQNMSSLRVKTVPGMVANKEIL